MCLFCIKTVTKQGFCKILWRNVFGEVFYLFNFNVNLIVTQVNKWILWCCLLDVRHRNVGKWFRCPESMESIRILQFEYERLLTFSAFRMGAYSKWALIQGWALIGINTVLDLSAGSLSTDMLFFVFNWKNLVASSTHSHLLALEVNKSPALYILIRALDPIENMEGLVAWSSRFSTLEVKKRAEMAWVWVYKRKSRLETS